MLLDLVQEAQALPCASLRHIALQNQVFMPMCKPSHALRAYDLASDLRCVSKDKRTAVYSIDVLHLCGTIKLACTCDTVSIPERLMLLARFAPCALQLCLDTCIMGEDANHDSECRSAPKLHVL